MKLTRLVILLAALTAALPARAQLIDGVVAVVGDELILKSEIDGQVEYFLYQNQIQRDDPRVKDIWKSVLDEAINTKILLTKAKLDSITAPQTEIDGQAERRIEFIKQKLGSDQAITDYFGKSIPQLRADIREEIRASLLVDGLRRKRFTNVSVSNDDVMKFYNAYKDSLPEIPEEIEAAFIAVRTKVSDESKKETLQKITEIERRLKAGEDFATLAKTFSEDPGSAKNGGDLGFIKRGEMVKPFEEAAFTLRDGQLSKPVETIFGYHIVQPVERRGESVRTRHILLQYDKAKVDEQAAIDKLTTLRQKAQSGEASFGLLARLYSEDEATAQQGGDIYSPQTQSNRIALDEFTGDPDLKQLIVLMKQGEISDPQRYNLPTGTAFRIVYLKYRAEKHKMNPVQDYAKLKGATLQRRQYEIYQEWIAELRKQVFWKVKI
jgi:peptidyl-prolyl cis-trans isomerase SurA